MRAPDPRRSAQTLLPSEVRAAGVFGIQDRGLASGLLGKGTVDTASGSLVRAPAVPPVIASPQAAALAAAWQTVAVSVCVAVSVDAIHVLDWEPDRGASRELTRFPRASTAQSLQPHRDARRLVLTYTPTGYRLPLTATVSRLNPYGAGVRAVLRELAVEPGASGAGMPDVS